MIGTAGEQTGPLFRAVRTHILFASRCGSRAVLPFGFSAWFRDSRVRFIAVPAAEASEGLPEPLLTVPLGLPPGLPGEDLPSVHASGQVVHVVLDKPQVCSQPLDAVVAVPQV